MQRNEFPEVIAYKDEDDVEQIFKGGKNIFNINLHRNCSRTRRKSERVVEIWETQDMETSKDNCEEWR